jgi:putative ATPase
LKQEELFADGSPDPDASSLVAPLADRMRPRSLDELLGQDDVVGPGTPLRAAIESGQPGSIILWGPPGSGKTSLARIIARRTRARWVPFSAVLSGIKEIKAVMAEAESASKRRGEKTLLFIDEIHRFNRAQQDAFLPYLETGSVVLIGATTENPSFEVNGALLSRCLVVTLRQLREAEITELARRALTDAERGLGRLSIEAADDAIGWLARQASGDARFALNVLEAAAVAGRNPITLGDLEQVVQRRALLYDKSGEEHFNLISALHKSLRNSDPDAALYWLARMLEAGEDPLYIARRLVRFASEDVGLAEPRALELAMAAKEAFHFIGLPEGKLALAETAVYLALAPKSNAVYRAYQDAASDALTDVAEPVPLQLRNPVTGHMKAWGYGKDYQYAHDFEEKLTAMDCLPERLSGRRYYRPTREGAEARLAERLEEIRDKKKKLSDEPGSR